MDPSTESELSLSQQVELLGCRDWRVAGAAFDALVAAGEPGMDAVIQGLSHRSASVRRACADFMDHQGTDACVERLLDLARHDPVPYVRRAAVHSLGCQRCKAAPLKADLVALLIERALSEGSPRVRRQAVGGLHFQPPDPRAAAFLRSLLHDETDPKLRRIAHHALKRHDPAYREEIKEQAKARARSRLDPASMGDPLPP